MLEAGYKRRYLGCRVWSFCGGFECKLYPLLCPLTPSTLVEDFGSNKFQFLLVEKFGETEFVMAIVKIIVLVGLILTCLIISLGGSPSGERIGFRYWNDPGAFAPYLATGDLGRFVGFWSCIVQASFMFMGCEVVGITYGEAKNPRKAIPRAVQQTIWRILVFYIGGVIVLGMTVPYTNDLLLSANKQKTSACKFREARCYRPLWHADLFFA